MIILVLEHECLAQRVVFIEDSFVVYLKDGRSISVNGASSVFDAAIAEGLKKEMEPPVSGHPKEGTLRVCAGSWRIYLNGSATR